MDSPTTASGGKVGDMDDIGTVRDADGVRAGNAVAEALGRLCDIAALRRPDDPLLVAGFEATGDEDVDQVALWELGLGRPRVLSAEGREVAAQRWYEGESGPTARVAVKAPAPCSTCGYFVPMAGALRAVFGVCANGWSPSDGRVVSLDHGCGAHSEVDLDVPAPERISPPVVDDFELDPA